MIDLEFHILKGTSDKPNYNRLKKRYSLEAFGSFFFFFPIGREYLMKCHKKK